MYELTCWEVLQDTFQGLAISDYKYTMIQEPDSKFIH